MLDQFLYPAPPSSYDDTSYPRELLYLPGRPGAGGPALFCVPRDQETGAPRAPRLVMLVLHGNAMDIGHIAVECQLFADALECTVIAPEYPGYGLYSQSTASKEGIDDAAWRAFRFARDAMGCPASRVLVMGRSIGTGVAAALARRAAQRREAVAGLVLISPYTSILGIVEDQAGCLSRFFQHRWRPEVDLRASQCPLLLLHGCQDTLIPPHHSAKLWDVIGGGRPGPPQGTELPDADMTHTRCYGAAQLGQWLRFSKNADHNSWEYETDILLPVASFANEVVMRRGRFLSSTSPQEIDVAPYLYAQRGRPWSSRHDSHPAFLCLGARPASGGAGRAPRN